MSQDPSGGRPLDHLVLPVADLPTARARYEALGFTVSPDAHHPFGTGNCRVFFSGRTYLEPIAVVDPAAVEAGLSDGLAFLEGLEAEPARRRTFPREGLTEGFAMAALKSRDALADHGSLRENAWGEPFSFVGKTTAPGNEAGEPQEYGVRLAFFGPEGDGAAGSRPLLFSCEPVGEGGRKVNDGLDDAGRPHQHPNGALGVVEVVAVAEEPEAFRPFLEAVLGVGGEGPGTSEPGTSEPSGSLAFALPGPPDAPELRTGFTVLRPAGFAARYGCEAPEGADALQFAAFEVATVSLELLEARGLGQRRGDRRVVAPAPGQGVVLAFRLAAEAPLEAS